MRTLRQGRNALLLFLALGIGLFGCHWSAKDEAVHGSTVGWPTRLLVDRSALPRDDRQFLRRLAQDTWRGLQALTDDTSGLPWDHVVLRDDSHGVAQAHRGDYLTTSSIGLYVTAIVAAHQLGFVDRPAATESIRKVIDAVQRLETYRGYCFNFYETQSLSPVGRFVSFADAAWLSAGLMVARQAFPELADKATRHLRQLDLGFFYDPKLQLMSHGYDADRHARSTYHYGTFFTEARLGSLIALGKHEAPWEHWARLERDFAGRRLGWSSMTAVAPSPSPSGCQSWMEFRFVSSWGGSMFEALMPELLFDEVQLFPRTLGLNARIHAVVQERYATTVLGYPVWGMSPSAKPANHDYAYGEFGTAVLGASGYPAGIVSPHASALALEVLPESVIANLRNLTERYDMYGDFGLYDAVDPQSGRVAHAYLALDQAMILVALTNYLTVGAHWSTSKVVDPRRRCRTRPRPLLMILLVLLGVQAGMFRRMLARWRRRSCFSGTDARDARTRPRPRSDHIVILVAAIRRRRSPGSVVTMGKASRIALAFAVSQGSSTAPAGIAVLADPSSVRQCARRCSPYDPSVADGAAPSSTRPHRVASSRASRIPSFMLRTPNGNARCAASPASQTRPRPYASASVRSKRIATDHIKRPDGAACHGKRSATSSERRVSSNRVARQGTIDGRRLLSRSPVGSSSGDSSIPKRVRRPGIGHQILRRPSTIVSRTSRRGSPSGTAAGRSSPSSSNTANVPGDPTSSSPMPSWRRTSEA